jgi:hypothetical protein
MSQSAMCASVPTTVRCGGLLAGARHLLAAAIRQMPKEVDSLRHTLAMSM